MNSCQANPGKILIVDDEKSMREFLEIMLLKDGYQVHTADSGKSALEAIQRNSFDMLITDIRMKPVNGLDVLKQCKAVSPGTVVIIISAYASTETAVAAMKEGAYDYLPKPFKVDEIRSVIEGAFRNRGEEKVTNPQEGPFYFDASSEKARPCEEFTNSFSGWRPPTATC